MDLSEHLGTTAEEELDTFLELTPTLVQARRSQLRIILDRFLRNRMAIVGACFLIFMFLFCFFGPFFWRLDPNQPSLNVNGTLQGPSWQSPFGTDDVGRDEMARAMYGGQVSLTVGFSSMLVALILGVGIGSFAGYYGGLIDNILMRVTDVALAVPAYLLLFVLAASFSDGSPRAVIILIAVFSWTYTSRLVRGEFLALKEREYVLAARTVGARDLRIMFRHILPNAIGPIIVNATLLIGANIIFESVLSYFGFGIRPPTASWGSMISYGENLIDLNPWLVFIPGLLIFFTVLSFNLVGDGLRDALDPHLTER
jgi:peptide/nickel transport system permease protein